MTRHLWFLTTDLSCRGRSGLDALAKEMRGGVAIFDPGVAGGERLRLRLGDYRRGGEVESFQALPGRPPRLGEIGGPRD